MHQARETVIDGAALLAKLNGWARSLGFSQIGVADVDLASAEPGLMAWLERGFHGQMHYMAAHGLKRARPAELVPGTVRVITARMDYLPHTAPAGWQQIEFDRLARPRDATVSLYAYINPVIAVLLGTFFLGEPLSPRLAVAGGAVLAGMALVRRQ